MEHVEQALRKQLLCFGRLEPVAQCHLLVREDHRILLRAREPLRARADFCMVASGQQFLEHAGPELLERFGVNPSLVVALMEPQPLTLEATGKLL